MERLPRRIIRATRHQRAIRQGIPLSTLFVTCRVYDHRSTSCCTFSVLSSVLDGKHSDHLAHELIRRRGLFSDLSTCVSNAQSTKLLRVDKGPSTNMSLRRTRTTIQGRLRRLGSKFIKRRRLRGMGGGFRSARVFNGVGCLGITAGLT